MNATRRIDFCVTLFRSAAGELEKLLAHADDAIAWAALGALANLAENWDTHTALFTRAALSAPTLMVAAAPGDEPRGMRRGRRFGLAAGE
jgi:hypothetical protein